MIVVVDYGMGNLRSVSKALEHLGGKVKVSSSPREIETADRLVLPGVGAFGDAIRELDRFKLIEPIKDYIASEKPFLGICLGLQLLFPASEESPGTKGLDVFQGRVQFFRSNTVKVPHMGWNSVKIRKVHPLLEGVQDGTYFYFVHSYYAAADDASIVTASCAYGEDQFAAILGTRTVFATQFHPEKSQGAGLKILQNFIQWDPQK
jgi:glutamine amidotransferase